MIQTEGIIYNIDLDLYKSMYVIGTLNNLKP